MPVRRHLQGARDRGRGHGQHVHVGAHLLELFLVLDAEALFLVDDHQPQVLELDGVREQPVGADDHVDGPVLQPLDDVLGFLRGLEARKRLHAHREARVAVGEGLVVLGGQQRGGHQHGDLLGVLHGLERGAHRDLGLAEADVAGDEPVHRDLPLHVRLDLVDGGQLVRGLHVGEGLLQLRLPRGVLGEGVAAGSHARGVQPDQVPGDLLDGLARLGLGAGPVRAAHLGQARRLAADVAGDLVQLVGGDKELVPRRPALGRRVLEDQVLALGVGAAGDLAGDQLDELGDAVLLVDHVVALEKGQRVHRVAPLDGHALGAARRVGAGAAQQVGLGEQPELQRIEHKAAAGLRRGDLDEPLGRLALQRVDPVRGDVRVVEELGQALRRARAVGGDDQAPVVLDARGNELHHLGHVALVAARLAGVDADGVDLRQQLGVGAQRGQRPPGHPRGLRVEQGLGQRGEVAGLQLVGGGLRLRLAEVQRGGTAVGGRGPGRGEELGVCRFQVVGAGAHAFGLHDQGDGFGGQLAQQRNHGIDKQRREGFHALHRNAAGDLGQHVAGRRHVLLQLGGLGHDGGRDQQLAAGRGLDLRRRLGIERALVGDREEAHGLDLVAEEVDAHRVGVGRREDIEDAAAHRELAAVGDHVDPRIGGIRQGPDHRGEGVLVPHLQVDGFELAKPRHQGLDDGADRGDDDLQARVLQLEAAQHGQASSDGVGARREPFVRKRLPGRELGDRIIGKVAAQPGTEVLGLAAGGRHGKHHGSRHLGLQCLERFRGDDGPHARGRGDLQLVGPRRVAGRRVGIHPGKRCVGSQCTAQTMKRHRLATFRKTGSRAQHNYPEFHVNPGVRISKRTAPVR